MMLSDQLSWGLKRAVALDIVAYGTPNCPNCGSTSVAEILYGLIDPTNIQGKLDRGEIVLGGCYVVGSGNPTFQCNACHEQFGKVARPDEQARSDQAPLLNDLRWEVFCAHQDWDDVTSCPLTAVSAASLEAVFLAAHAIEGEAEADVVRNRFFCDHRGDDDVWGWLYRAGEAFVFDEGAHRLVRRQGNLFDHPGVDVISAEAFSAHVNARLLAEPKRRVQVGIAQYTGVDNAWRHDWLYEVEILLDHTFRLPTAEGGWQTLALPADNSAYPGAVGYRDHDWIVGYQEYIAKAADQLAAYPL